MRQRGEQRYSSTHALTSALGGVGGQLHVPAALPPGIPRYPLYRRLGGRQGRCGKYWEKGHILNVSDQPPTAAPAAHVWAPSRSGRAEEKTKTPALAIGNRTKPPDIAVSSLVTIPTEL
jgi:hypothetical protein